MTSRSDEPPRGAAPGTHRAATRGLGRFFPTLSGYQRAWLGPDLIAGVTLAAVAIPECMGYTRIAGTPVITGLYTILLPLLAFALFGSSRHLVVGADSATAAILFAGLIGLAQPNASYWLALASTSALLCAIFLVLAGVLRLGFLSDFLSRTVLVGFLSGVGVSLLVGELPHILGVAVKGKGALAPLGAAVGGLPHAHLPTLAMALAVLAIMVGCERVAPRVPGSLLAVVLAIGGTWALHLERYGLQVVGPVPPGLPSLRLPDVRLSQVGPLISTSLSMFLVIIAQSAATARSFANRYSEPLDENRDLLALGLANALAGLSGTFVVNGSPTKTAVVASAGGRTQVAQIAAVAVTLAVLLFATSLIAHLPNAVLSAIVFLIGVKLVDLPTLREIRRFRRTTFAVASATLLGVVILGVERGIFVAIGFSILDHLQQEYHPRDVLLVPLEGQGEIHGEHGWKAELARPGLESEPGLLVYRFEAPLFFANADYFAARVQALIRNAPHPVRWLVLDMVSVADVDFTAGLTLLSLIERLQKQEVTVVLAQCEGIKEPLQRLGIIPRVGPSHIFGSVFEAVEAFRQDSGAAGRPGWRAARHDGIMG